jgi:hypothetical protein
MKARAIIALLVVFVFTVGMAGLSFAAEVKGTVTKIEGNKITVRDAAGKETTVEVKSTADIKVGYRVTVKGGEVTIERPRRAIQGC